MFTELLRCVSLFIHVQFSPPNSVRRRQSICHDLIFYIARMSTLAGTFVCLWFTGGTRTSLDCYHNRDGLTRPTPMKSSFESFSAHPTTMTSREGEKKKKTLPLQNSKSWKQRWRGRIMLFIVKLQNTVCLASVCENVLHLGLLRGQIPSSTEFAGNSNQNGWLPFHFLAKDHEMFFVHPAKSVLISGGSFLLFFHRVSFAEACLRPIKYISPGCTRLE